MTAILIIVAAIILLLIGYVGYGSWLAKQWGIDPKKSTPAVEMETVLIMLQQNRQSLWDTIFHLSQVPARSTDQSRQQYSDGYRYFCGASSEASSSADFRISVLYLHLSVIKVNLSVRSSVILWDAEPRDSLQSLRFWFLSW